MVRLDGHGIFCHGRFINKLTYQRFEAKKIIMVSASILILVALIILGIYFVLNVVFNPQGYLEDGMYIG